MARDWATNSDWAVSPDWAWDWLEADWATNDDWFGIPPEAYGGTIAGTATVTGTLTNQAAGAKELAGTPTGLATVAAALTQIHEATGAPAGIGSVTGTLAQVHELAGAPAGVASVTAALTVASLKELAGTIAGTATVTADLNVIASLAGTTTGTSTITGSIDPPLTPSAIAGTATVTGTLVTGAAGAGFPIPYPLPSGVGRDVVNLRAVSRGMATVVPALSQSHDAAASVAGVATVADVPRGDLTYRELILNQNPAYYYKLDEIESTTSPDATGNEVSLTWNSDPVRSGSLVYDEAILDQTGGAFGPGNSSGDRVQYTSGALTQSPGSLSVEVLLEFSSIAAGQRAVVNGNTGNANYEYAVQANYNPEEFRFYWRYNTGDTYVKSTFSPVNGTYYHVVGVADLDAAKLYLYINGELDNQLNLPSTTPFATGPTNYFQIGGDLSHFSGFPWKGTLDEVAVYHKALSPFEIRKHYETAVSGNNGVGFENRAVLDENRYRSSAGSASIVLAVLSNGVPDANGNAIVELEGSSSGVGSCLNTWVPTQPRPGADPDTWYAVPQLSQALYLYMNVGVGFEPTDTYSGTPVTQTFPDGHVRDFDRVLYLYHNVGVGFDPTDDASGDTGFVSQIFPDGHVRQFDRVLYDYLCVIEDQDDRWWVTIGPTPETVPPNQKAKPPKSRA